MERRRTTEEALGIEDVNVAPNPLEADVKTEICDLEPSGVVLKESLGPELEGNPQSPARLTVI